MPINVPLIEKSVETRPLGATPLGASLRPLSDPYIATNGAANLGKALQDAGELFKQRGDQTALLQTQKAMDDWEASNLYDPTNGALAKKGQAAFDLPNTVGDKYNADMAKIQQGLSNADQQAAFEKMATSRRDNIMRTLYAHERDQMDGFRKATGDAAMDSSINRAALNYNNPTVVDASINNAKAAKMIELKQNGLDSPDIVEAEMAKVEGKAHMGVLTRMADNNPKAAIDYFTAHQDKFGENLLSAQRLIAPTERKYKAVNLAQNALMGALPKADQGQIIDYVMNDLEGGDKVVADGDGVAKYGINSKANPDLDVPNLTADQAKQRFTDNYWNKFDIGKLPADMRLPVMAFAATNEAEVPRLLKEANGDPHKFQELAADFYQSLATKDPEKYGKNLSGWMNRISKVNSQIDLLHGEIPDDSTITSKIDGMTDDVEVASDAKAIVSKQITDIKQARTTAENTAAREVAKYQAGGQEPPPSLISRLGPEQQKDFYAKSFDPMEYERVRRQVTYGQPVDLDQLRFRINPKQFDDLVEMQGDPTKQETARTVDKRVIDSAQKVLGKSYDKVKTKEDFENLQTFRNTIYSSIDAFQRTNKKAPSTDEVNKLVDDLVLKPSGGSLFSPSTWGMGDSQAVGGIPKGRTYMIGGEENSYEQVISLLSKYARARNIPVNPQNLADIYKSMSSSKLIVEKYAR